MKINRNISGNVASMTAFAVMIACYNNIAIQLPLPRDAGVLKGTRGTPLPSAVFFGAKVVHALLRSLHSKGHDLSRSPILLRTTTNT